MQTLDALARDARALADGVDHVSLAGEAGDDERRHRGALLAQRADHRQARAIGQVHVDQGQLQVVAGFDDVQQTFALSKAEERLAGHKGLWQQH